MQGEKLYVLGGGWSLIWAQTFPAQHQFAMAAGILVPWLETNSRHSFRLHVRTDEGVTLGDFGGDFEQGRPAGLPAGTTQRVMLAVNMTLQFAAPLDAVAELWLDGDLARSVAFRVAERPKQA